MPRQSSYNVSATCPHVALTLLLLILSTPLCAQNFALPEVLLLIEGQPDGTTFGAEFTCVGDQNSDGYDDLLIPHDPFWRQLHEDANRVELYYGGEEMDGEPDGLLTTDLEEFYFGERVCFVGNIMPDRNPFVVLQNALTEPRFHNKNEYHLYIYETGDEWDSEPEFVFRSAYNNEDEIPTVVSGFGLKYRPTDFNGDGLDDIMLLSSLWLVEEERNDSRLLGLWGGADFDTIPDWSSVIMFGGGGSISGGYDLNGDGYQDILVQYLSSYLVRSKTTSLFLGGNPPDTSAHLTLPYDYFEGLEISDFSLLPDINSDGYDDWGIAFDDDAHWPRDGYFIFYGGPDPDMEPDVELDGNDAIGGGGDGRICGGDINGDGYGDVVCGRSSSRHGDGQINLHFGRLGWPEFKEADLSFDGYSDFPPDQYRGFGTYLDGIGDYNNDGLDDFVTRSAGKNVIVFSGSREWRVNVDEEQIPTHFQLNLIAYPNPFNNTTTLSFRLPLQTTFHLTIYNLSGQEVVRLADSNFPAGSHTVTWTTEGVGAGVYFAVLIMGSDATKVASTCKKLVILK